MRLAANGYRIGAAPEGEGSLGVDIEVPSDVEVASMLPVVAVRGVRLQCRGVALRRKHCHAALLVVPASAVAVIHIGVDGKLVVGIDIRQPG